MARVTVGRIVQYILSSSDAEEINRRRVRDLAQAESWPKGAQAHTGNHAEAGDILPMIVCRVWDEPIMTVNGQVFLDGNDTYLATSRHEGMEPGNWFWPAMV